MSFVEVISPIEEIIDEARNGRMFILVDDEDRENEGDLIVPAQMATPDAINFMAKHGRGLICLALTRQRVEQLNLKLMSQANASRLQTAFTLSIEARDGVTTGISASDRARTVAVAIDPTKGPEDIVIPGHVFPLAARDGGVLVRTGHTEAAVDIARLAGLNPSGVICEIMNDDGTMARREDLIAFAQFHGLKIATIAELIAYRRRHDRTVERTFDHPFETEFGGDFRLLVYNNKPSGIEHLAFVKGDVSGPAPVLVRMHAMNMLDDMFASVKGGRAGMLRAAFEAVAKAGRGVVVVLREPMPSSLTTRAHELIVATPPAGALRDYGIGAQILIDLGVHEMILLSNTDHTIIGLDGYGLRVVGRQSIKMGR
ncbi:MAG TPA: 3,4-dihydroxy-2-butanone-4-phosphate synthase [Stellaceae bacterium]|jgi:3,4-dihydroxy 2-butanone 4-phosphate synthase/GTP cyclohydrolase II|nr:3,4-dihydroxy-2-butanone-4-phosphate synthase [Stellaceae bacterium]